MSAPEQTRAAMETTSPIGTFTLDYTPLRMRRRALGLTLRRMQTITGINYAVVHEIEWGKQEPQVKQLVALSRALGVPLWDLYTIKEKRT